MIQRLLLSVVSLSVIACGRADLPAEDVSAPDGASTQQPQLAQPAEPGVEPMRLVPAELPSRLNESVAAGLAVSATGSFPAGLSMRVITGLMSCGFMETGRVDALTQTDGFSVRVPQVPAWGINVVLVWIDRDGDAQCGAGDTAFMVDLPYGGAPVGLDLATAGSADCWWFAP